MTTQGCDQEYRREDRAHEGRLTPEAESNLGVVLLRVAWLAILLGLAMEVLLLLVTGFGDVFGLKSFTADLVKKVSWSVLVCAGLAVGATLSKIRNPMMGILGFLAAPLAFEVSRGLHKGTLEALAVGGADAVADAGPSPLLLALIKGIEYGCLGLAIAWVSRRSWGGIARLTSRWGWSWEYCLAARSRASITHPPRTPSWAPGSCPKP